MILSPRRGSLLLTAMTLLAAAAATLPTYADPAPRQVTLDAGELSVTLSPAAKWTLRGIRFEGGVIGQPNGNYGTVLAYESGKLIGAGHTEGGEEEVLEARLVCDGTDITQSTDTTFRGETFERFKKSRLGEAITLESTLRIHATGLSESIRVTATADTSLHHLYPLMLIWSTQTTEWAGQTADGRYLAGTLISDNQWKVREDLRWLAVFNPETQVAAITRFPEDFPAGQIHKHTIWDHEAYHKQYFMTSGNESWPQGEERLYQYEVSFLPIKTGDWQGEVDRFLSSKP
ncbi:MAG TPA: hypothetical protein VNQ90_09475 [Chthoniobacteraceae bacterium]|nr:hypothetical protein [Chthoniobacteraceae bacterium]